LDLQLFNRTLSCKALLPLKLKGVFRRLWRTRWRRQWLYDTLKLFNGYKVEWLQPKVAPAG
jgi:hypothetical protein